MFIHSTGLTNRQLAVYELIMNKKYFKTKRNLGLNKGVFKIEYLFVFAVVILGILNNQNKLSKNIKNIK